MHGERSYPGDVPNYDRHEYTRPSLTTLRSEEKALQCIFRQELPMLYRRDRLHMTTSSAALEEVDAMPHELAERV